MADQIIYYCESPFQLYIAKKMENRANGKIVYRYIRVEDRVETDEKVMVVRGLNIFDNLKFVIAVVKADIVISGSFKSRYLNLILNCLKKKKSVRYFDDGTASIEANEKIRKKFVYSFFHGNIKYKFSFHLNKNLNFDHQQSWFIGQNISEVGLIEDAEYFAILERWWRKTKGKDRLYFSHRRESNNKLARIKNLYPSLLFAEYDEICIEEFIEIKGTLPNSIYGIASSCLLTISKLFGDEVEINIPSNIKLDEKSSHFWKINAYLLDLNERNTYGKF